MTRDFLFMTSLAFYSMTFQRRSFSCLTFFFVCLTLGLSSGCHSSNTGSNLHNLYLQQREDKDFKLSYLKKINDRPGFEDSTSNKVLFTIDANCGDCVHRLEAWRSFQNKQKSRTRKFPTVICVVQGGETTLFKRFVAEHTDVDITFYVDEEYLFSIENDLMRIDKKYMFLDHDNRLAYIGDPIENSVDRKFFNQFFFEE